MYICMAMSFLFVSKNCWLKLYYGWPPKRRFGPQMKWKNINRVYISTKNINVLYQCFCYF